MLPTLALHPSSNSPALRRGTVIDFDRSTWTATVALDGAIGVVDLPAGDWLLSGLAADQVVACLLFDDTNPNDGLVLGDYGGGAEVLQENRVPYTDGDGLLTTSSSLAFDGTALGVGTASLGGNGERLRVSWNPTDTSGTKHGLSLTSSPAPASNSSADFRCINVKATSNSDANFTGAIRAMAFLTSHDSDGTLTSGWGAFGIVRSTSAGDLTTGYGFYVSVDNSSSGTLSTGYGLYVPAVSNSGGGTYSLFEGIHVQDQTAANANYAIRTNGGLVVFNESGTSGGDFRVESDSYDALFVDASDNSLAMMNHASGKIGFFGATPVVRASAYSVSNLTTDRTYDANSTSIAELADVLGTLIADLKNYGLLQ